MRLPRPYIPRYVRCQVVARQLGITPAEINEQIERARSPGRWGAMLKDALLQLAEKMECPPERLQLDHNPALENRLKQIRLRNGRVVQSVIIPPGASEVLGYWPTANDPDYLIYRTAEDHRLKTNVRGDGAQYPDRVLIKRERRRNKKKRIRPRRRWPKGRKIPSRKVQSHKPRGK